MQDQKFTVQRWKGRDDAPKGKILLLYQIDMFRGVEICQRFQCFCGDQVFMPAAVIVPQIFADTAEPVLKGWDVAWKA